MVKAFLSASYLQLFQGLEISCQPFNKQALHSALKDIRGFTKEENTAKLVPKLIKACANVGVALALVPAPKGCPVSGATRWLDPNKALLILSDRYKTNGQFWFSFFHEVAHIILHRKKLMFIDLENTLDGSDEQGNCMKNRIDK